MTDDIPPESHRLITSIFTPQLMVLLKIGEDVLSSDVEQGSDDFPALDRHPQQAKRAAASQQPKQDRLNLIVGMVPKGDSVQIESVGKIFQSGVSDVPGRFFKAGFVKSGRSRDIRSHTEEIHGEAVTKILTEALFNPCRARTKPMINVYGGEPKGQPRLQVNEQMQQSHGVGTAGQSDQYTISVVQQLIIDNRLLDARTEIHVHKIQEATNKRTEKSHGDPSIVAQTTLSTGLTEAFCCRV
jgi:hypothetical protein